jgi:hypothetical protein
MGMSELDAKRKTDMTSTEKPRSGLQFNTPILITAAALVGFGSLLGGTGLALAMGELVAVTRRWMRDKDVTPSELARQTWAQAKAATTAGADAWRSAQQG